MGRQQGAIDTGTFKRTALLFAEKRNAFAPDAVEALAADIVRRLANARLQGQAIDAPEIAEDSIAAFCDALVQPEPDAALRFIQDRRAEGVTVRGLYLGYIADAARYLGARWEEDLLSFLQVTIGTGHLYALMRALRAEDPPAVPAFDSRRCALFATVPGEDHGIGITVAADLFRKAGWDIDLQTDSDHDALVAHVEKTRPQIVGLSLSTEQRLDALVRLVVAIRILLPHVIIGVATSAKIDAKRLHGLVDIDLVFEDATTAHLALDRLIMLRG